MNQNYFTPPNARNSLNPFKSPSENASSPLKYSENPSYSRDLRFLSNPKSEYEDRQALLKKAHNEELRKSYKSHLEQLKAAKSLKSTEGSKFQLSPSRLENSSISVRTNQGRLSPELIKAGKLSTDPSGLYFSPQIQKKDLNQVNNFNEFRQSHLNSSPWIEDYSRREEELVRKKDLWIQSLNQQINEKKLEKEKKNAEQLLKEKQEEARIRRELQELDLRYKKEINEENGEPFYSDESIKQISLIANQKETKFVREPESPSIFSVPNKSSHFSSIFKERKPSGSKKFRQFDEKQKLVELRSNMNELIKDLKFEAQASKYEKDEILHELHCFRNLIHDKRSTEEFASPGLMRAGKSMLTRYKPDSFPYRSSMNIY